MELVGFHARLHVSNSKSKFQGDFHHPRSPTILHLYLYMWVQSRQVISPMGEGGVLALLPHVIVEIERGATSLKSKFKA